VSQTLRACLRALQTAAWIEAMILAHRAVEPHGAASWSWFLVRCVLFSLGAYVAVGVAAQIVQRRDAGRPGAKQGEPPAANADAFDAQAFESAAIALLFHFGAPLWMWVFA
jgi:hypothetical protein